MNEFPSTPERYSMRLRSVCRQYGCNLSDHSDYSPKSSPRQSEKHLSRKLSHHHHHHHHHHNHLHRDEFHHREVTSSHDLRSSSATSVADHARLQSMNQRRERNSTLSTKVVSAADLLVSFKRSYSDYSSGNEDSDFELREKTDYTYARSGSYSSRVTPSRPCSSPNMSRTRLTRSHNSSANSSSGEEDFMLFSRGIVSGSNHSRASISYRSNLNGSFENNTKTFKNSHHLYSADTKHAYGLDSEFSETEEFHAKTVSTTLASYLQRFFLLRWLSLLTGWLWYGIWHNLYRVTCHVLLLDTWLLSRSCHLSNRRRFMFIMLPLFLPFLLLLGSSLCGLGDKNLAATGLSHVAGTAFSTLSAFVSSFLTLWTNTSGAVAKSWSPDWRYLWGSDSVHKVPDLSDGREDIHRIVRSIFKDEFSGLMEQVTREQTAFVQKQIEELSRQSVDMKTLQQKHLEQLSKDFLNLKLSIEATSRESKAQGGENVEQTVLHAKLEHLEGQLHGMQDILLSMKNCCRNQSDYIQAAERHLVSLLLQVTNRTGKPHDGPFAAFGSWMSSQFVRHGQLADVSRRAEGTARQVAASLVFGSLQEFANNFSAASSRAGGQGTCISAEEVKDIVRDAIYLYDADKTGLVDYALESSGGSVISTRCAETYHTGTAQFRIFGIPFWYTSNSPRTVIQPGVQPGQCWAFRGTHGYLVVELSATVRPTAFSVEHIPKSLSPTGSIDSAPKDFSVLGLKKESDLEGVLLGRYKYDADGEPLQYFAVEDPEVDFYPIMELRIHSNYGNQDYTCLYRFRVHGMRQ